MTSLQVVTSLQLVARTSSQKTAASLKELREAIQQQRELPDLPQRLLAAAPGSDLGVRVRQPAEHAAWAERQGAEHC